MKKKKTRGQSVRRSKKSSTDPNRLQQQAQKWIANNDEGVVSDASNLAQAIINNREFHLTRRGDCHCGGATSGYAVYVAVVKCDEEFPLLLMHRLSTVLRESPLNPAPIIRRANAGPNTRPPQGRVPRARS